MKNIAHHLEDLDIFFWRCKFLVIKYNMFSELR